MRIVRFGAALQFFYLLRMLGNAWRPSSATPLMSTFRGLPTQGMSRPAWRRNYKRAAVVLRSAHFVQVKIQ
jgi:hypothetical protein